MKNRLEVLFGDKDISELLSGFDGLSDVFPEEELPWLDKESADSLELTANQQAWRDDGMLIVEGLLPDDLIDAYRESWIEHNRTMHNRPYGYPGLCAYMKVPSLLNLATSGELGVVMADLIGEPMGVHLNLTGWKSSERNWHQDGYLNHDFVRDWYLAVWIALDDIHEDAGPFEFVRGSHFLPTITQDKALAKLEKHERKDPSWPKYSERFLNPLFDRLIDEGGLKVEKFLAKKGDVMFWHTRLMHRGSAPKNPELWRETVILHYSGVNHRPDMPPAIQRGDGWYFPIHEVRQF